jgi:NNP family nitrate/nitrite transporter-like MFS transporter
MTGAYGNVGVVVYLTVLSMISYQACFLVIAVTAVAGFITLLFMQGPKGAITEILEDGTVQLIKVS